MTPTPETADGGDSPTFGPQQAAALLDQTTQQARRRLQPSPPWLLATRAVMVLAACGAVWLTVRGQHPYRGPTPADIPILIVFIIVNFSVTVGVREHALAGIRGRSRLRPAEIAILVAAWAAVPVVMWALAAAGVSYSLYPTTVLIVPGAAWAIVSAARAGWPACATGIAVVAVGIAGLFAGPAGAWAVAAVGLFAVLAGKAVFNAWRLRG